MVIFNRISCHLVASLKCNRVPIMWIVFVKTVTGIIKRGVLRFAPSQLTLITVYSKCFVLAIVSILSLSSKQWSPLICLCVHVIISLHMFPLDLVAMFIDCWKKPFKDFNSNERRPNMSSRSVHGQYNRNFKISNNIILSTLKDITLHATINLNINSGVEVVEWVLIFSKQRTKSSNYVNILSF